MSEPPSEPQDDAGKKPADDDAARRERDIDRLARCIADGEPLAGDVGDTGTHFAAFVELQNVVDGFRRVQQRFANRQPAKSPSFRFGQLEVLDKLGEGAQAEVYRAYDPLLDQCFALKIRRIEFGALSNDFLEEAKHLARVHLGRVLRALGDASGARDALESAAAWHRAAGGGEQARLGECLLAAMDAAESRPGSDRRLGELLDAARAHHEPHVEVFALDALARLTARHGDSGAARALRAEADRRMQSASHFITEQDRVDARSHDEGIVSGGV